MSNPWAIAQAKNCAIKKQLEVLIESMNAGELEELVKEAVRIIEKDQEQIWK